MRSQPLDLLALIDRAGPVFSTGVFAGTEAGGNLAVRVLAAACLDRQETPCTRAMIQMGTAIPTIRQDTLTPTDHIQIAAFGMPEIVTEFTKPRKELLPSESKQWNSIPERSEVKDPDVRRAMKLIDLTLAYHPLRQYVGGKIDAVVLHRGRHMEWISRKANCPAN